MEQRGDHLKIYEVASEKCRQCVDSSVNMHCSFASVPTLTDIWLKLLETEVQHGNLSGSVSTLTEGLAIEKSQYAADAIMLKTFELTLNFRMLLQHHVMSLGSACSVAQKNELLDRQRKLEARISACEHQVSVVMKLDDETQWSTQDRKMPEMNPQVEEVLDDLLDLYPKGWFTPEKE